MAAKHTLLPHASRNISRSLSKLTSKQDIFPHRNVWNPNMKSVFHTALREFISKHMWQECVDDMSLVFSPPSWGCHSASLLINSPQGATDPRLHWPYNGQLASDWIINRMCYPQNSQRWAQSPRSNLWGSSIFKTKRTPLYNWARRIHLKGTDEQVWILQNKSRATVEILYMMPVLFMPFIVAWIVLKYKALRQTCYNSLRVFP